MKTLSHDSKQKTDRTKWLGQVGALRSSKLIVARLVFRTPLAGPWGPIKNQLHLYRFLSVTPLGSHLLYKVVRLVGTFRHWTFEVFTNAQNRQYWHYYYLLCILIYLQFPSPFEPYYFSKCKIGCQ